MTSQPRVTPAGGAVRVLRAGSFALAAVALALTAHTVAGGGRPTLLPLLAATVVLGCAATVATGRRLGRLTTATGLVLAQLGLHTWFSLTAGHGCDVRGLVLTGHHHALEAGCPPGAVDSAPHAVAPGPWALVMPAAHLLAVIGTALLLAHGEALLWRLADLAGHHLVALAHPVPVDVRPARRPAAVVVAVPALSSRYLLDPARRRGPPDFAAAG